MSKPINQMFLCSHDLILKCKTISQGSKDKKYRCLTETCNRNSAHFHSKPASLKTRHRSGWSPKMKERTYNLNWPLGASGRCFFGCCWSWVSAQSHQLSVHAVYSAGSDCRKERQSAPGILHLKQINRLNLKCPSLHELSTLSHSHSRHTPSCKHTLTTVCLQLICIQTQTNDFAFCHTSVPTCTLLSMNKGQWGLLCVHVV